MNSYAYGRKKVRKRIATCLYTDEVTDLLARRIRKMPEYADCKIESRGPFGLGATCHVSVKRGEELLGFLTINYGPHGFGAPFEYTDYNAPKKHTYPDGSLGDLNGFNHVTRPLPMDIDEALKLVFKKEELA